MAGKRKDSKGRVLKAGESERKDGRYMYRYTSASGKRNAIYANTLQELREKEGEIELSLLQGIEISNMTLNELFAQYMSFRKSKIKLSTYTTNENYWKWYVKDTIGTCKIKDIKQMHIVSLYQEYIDGKRSKALSEGTIKYINWLVNGCFELAKANDLILKNPCENIMKALKCEKSKGRKALTERQQQLFLQTFKEMPNNPLNIYEPLFIVAFNTGLRIGELLALTWEDIDKINGAIKVSKTMQYRTIDSKGQFFVTTPKTEKGNRTIPMLPDVIEALKKQREYQMMIGNPKGEAISGYKNFIFTTSTGKPYTDMQVNAVIKRIVKHNNNKALAENRKEDIIPIFSAHVIRHTFCTMLCERGVELKAIQEIMGHRDISTTMNIYTHVSEEKKKKEMLKLVSVAIA